MRLIVLLVFVLCFAACTSPESLESTAEETAPAPFSTEEIVLPATTEEARILDFESFSIRASDLLQRAEAIEDEDLITSITALQEDINNVDLASDDYDAIWGDINERLNHLGVLLYQAELRANQSED